LLVHNDMPWEWDPSLNIEFILCFHLPHTHSLKEI
jgi:hypothetical protein